MAECEAVACEWGFEEMLLKVEPSNVDAVRLYRDFGYAVVGELEAEKPRASGFGVGYVRWQPTSLLCMRKELKLPPPPPQSPSPSPSPTAPETPTARKRFFGFW